MDEINAVMNFIMLCLLIAVTIIAGLSLKSDKELIRELIQERNQAIEVARTAVGHSEEGIKIARECL